MSHRREARRRLRSPRLSRCWSSRCVGLARCSEPELLVWPAHTTRLPCEGPAIGAIGATHAGFFRKWLRASARSLGSASRVTPGVRWAARDPRISLRNAGPPLISSVRAAGCGATIFSSTIDGERRAHCSASARRAGARPQTAVSATTSVILLRSTSSSTSEEV